MTELARIETVLFLQGVEFFSSCSAEQILRISAIVRQRQLAEGEKVYAPGDAAEALFCVVEGGVRIGDGDGAQRAGPGDTFGAVEILSGRLRSQAVVAEQDSLVLAIPSEDFFDLLANNIEIVKALFRQILKRRDSMAGGRS